jgi:hypothetical protein
VATAVQPKKQPCSYLSCNFCVFLFFHVSNFSYLLKNYWQLRSIIDTCYRLPAVAAVAAAVRVAAPAPQVDHRRSAIAGTSAHEAGGHAAINLQPPSIYRYPSFDASFGQSIADVVGRNRKLEV